MQNAQETREVVLFHPRQVQAEIFQNLKRFNVLVCHRRMGKALDVETPVPMADGTWSTMGALVAGDRIIGADGHSTTVTMAHPIMTDRKCYEMEFQSGEVIVADEDHLWVTTRKMDRHNPVRSPEGRINQPRPAKSRTTKEIAETLRSRGENNHRIPVAGPARFEEKRVPIRPYLLGLWLGDGTSRTAEITTMDEEIVAEMAFAANGKGWSLKANKWQNAGRATTYRIKGGFQADLRTLGVLGNKHIPTIYKQSSVAHRLALLRGLMDTDGSVDGQKCEITQKNYRLAKDIEEIILSLGMNPSFGVKNINGVDYFRLTFRPMVDVFALPRKSEKFSDPPERLKWQSIVRCDPVKTRPVRCITVDAEDSQFCVGRKFTVTHNTVLCINILIRAALEGRQTDMRFAYIAPLFRQAKQVAWDYLKEYTDPIPGRKFYENELKVDLPNGARIQLFGADNPDALRGIYLDGVILDEYAQMRPGLWGSVIRPLLTDRQGFGLFIGTPQGHNEFYDLYINARDGFPDDLGKRTPDPTWKAFMYPASSTGVIDENELAAARREMSAAEFDQEFECSFEAQIRGAYYADLIGQAEEEGRICTVPYDKAVPVHTAWDIGIGDSTVIWYFQLVGQEIHWIDYYEASGKPLSDYVMELQEHEYVYGEHLLPHDIRARELLAGKSREDVLQELLNYRCRVVENHKVDDGIQNVRNNLGKSWFDRGNCSRGIEALRQYRREFDENQNVFKGRPLHNWASHPADSFRIGCMGMHASFSWPEMKLPKRKFV